MQNRDTEIRTRVEMREMMDLTCHHNSVHCILFPVITMPEFDLTLVDAVDFLKNCGLTGDEAAVQAEQGAEEKGG